MCFDIWADYSFTEVSPNHSWSSNCSSDNLTSLLKATPGCPQQTPCNLQDQGPSTGYAAEARQHRKTEVLHTQCQKSSRGLVNQRYETHGGLYPNADILKAAPSH